MSLKYSKKLESSKSLCALRLGLGIMLFMIAFAADGVSQLSTSELVQDCTSITEKINVPQYVEYVTVWPNGTKQDVKSLVKVDVKENIITSCKPNPQLTVNGRTVNYSVQNYACAQENDYVICDSKIDGNGDGICSPNGGETCCRIKNGIITCKNSNVNWDEISVLPVKELS